MPRPSTRMHRTEERQLAVAVARRSRINGAQLQARLNPQLLSQIDSLIGTRGPSREDVIVYLIMKAVNMRQRQSFVESKRTSGKG